MSDKPSPLHRPDCKYTFDIITGNDLKLEDTMIIAANAFCVTIVYHYEEKCYKIKPDYSIFPESPKIHLLVNETKSCILLNKTREKDTNYNILKDLTKEIEKNEKQLKDIEKEKKTKASEKKGLKSQLESIRNKKKQTEKDKEQFNTLKEDFNNVLQKINTVLEDYFINTYCFVLLNRKNENRSKVLKEKLNKDLAVTPTEEVKSEKSREKRSKNPNTSLMKVSPNQLLLTETYFRILEYEESKPSSKTKTEEKKVLSEVKRYPAKVEKGNCKICGRKDRKGYTLYEAMFLCDCCIYIENWKRQNKMKYFQGLINDEKIDITKLERFEELKSLLPNNTLIK
jgi:hypothetical protein